MSEMRKVKEGLDILYSLKRPGQNAFCAGEGDYIYGCGPSPSEVMPHILSDLAENGWVYDATHCTWKFYIN